MKTNKTTDYKKFKIVDGNRNVVVQHVKKMVETIKRQNLMEYHPILVNEKFEIIDGQHRLEALKILKLPVTYHVVKGTDLKTVQMLNSSSKSWTSNDYIESYIKLGKQDYQLLNEFYKSFQLPLGIAIALLRGDNMGRVHQVSEIIKSGNFKVKNLSYAEAIAIQLQELRKCVDKRLFMDRDLTAAFVKVFDNSNINAKQLRRKMSLYGTQIRKQFTVTEYLREIERIYNYRNQGEKIRLF